MNIKSDLAVVLLIVCFLVAVIPPSFASPIINQKMTSELYAPPPGKGKKPPRRAAVDIRNLGNDDVEDHIRRGAIVDVVAQVTEDANRVTYRIDDESEVDMSRWGDTDRYSGSWTVDQVVGSHTVTVTSYGGGRKKPKTYTDTATVIIVSGYEAEIWYEIDYLTGHNPTTAMLNYWVNYWDSRAIIAHPVLDDEINDTKYLELDISLFWEVESIYNDDLPADGDDRAYGNVNNGNPFLQEKWMLWGAYWSEANIGGFCYVWRLGYDGLAGNYIYINDGGLADWEASHGLTNGGGRIVALMHETGHSIGVVIFDRFFNEVYDSDYYSVMAMIYHDYNAAFTNLWYYSHEYWKTRNLEYY